MCNQHLRKSKPSATHPSRLPPPKYAASSAWLDLALASSPTSQRSPNRYAASRIKTRNSSGETNNNEHSTISKQNSQIRPLLPTSTGMHHARKSSPIQVQLDLVLSLCKNTREHSDRFATPAVCCRLSNVATAKQRKKHSLLFGLVNVSTSTSTAYTSSLSPTTNRWKSFIRQSQNRQLALNAGFFVCSRTISASVTSLVRRTSQTLSHVYLSIRTKINSRQSSQNSQSVSTRRAVHQTLYRSRTSSKPLQKTVNSCLSGPRSSEATSRVYLGLSLLFATSSQSLATLYSEARASYHPLPFTAASLTSPMKAIMVS